MECTHVIKNTLGLRFQITPIQELDNNISTLFSQLLLPHILTKVHIQYFWLFSVVSAVGNKTENCIAHADSLATGTPFPRLVTEYCMEFEYRKKVV
jgi:hypothetical protein